MSPKSASSSSLPVSSSVKKASQKSTSEKMAEDEFMASAIGDVEWLRQSIRPTKHGVNYDKNGLAAVHLASIHGRLECLKLLIEKMKVDVNLASTTGWRPVHLCISNQTGRRSFICLSYLLSHGADPSITNEDGVTPMHQAASEGHVNCLKALIDAGGILDATDHRGHKPINLAKLWGHRKCARILATEQWHQDKVNMAIEMAQLHRVKMDKALQQMEIEDQIKADQEFYGDLAFKQWMNNKGLKDKTDGDALSTASSVSDRKSKVSQTPSESLHKANSRQATKDTEMKRIPSPIIEEQVKAKNDELYAEYQREVTDDGGLLLYDGPVKEATPKQEEPAYKGFYNDKEWIKSTKLGMDRFPYEPLLPDHYPRDEFTKKPKFPPKRKDKRAVERALDVRSGSSHRRTGTAMTMPNLPQDVIDSVLYPEEFERPVVYKCKHIGDVHKRKHYDSDANQIRKPETGLHLTDDVSSAMFRLGLEKKIASRGSSSSTQSSCSLPQIMATLERMSNAPKFLATSG